MYLFVHVFALWFFHKSQSNVELRYAQNNVNHNYQLIAVSTLFFFFSKTEMKHFNMLQVEKKRVKRANVHRRKADNMNRSDSMR